MDEIYKTLIANHFPFIVVAFFLGMFGEVVKRLVIPKENPKVLTGWRGVYRATLTLHSALAGAAIGAAFSAIDIMNAIEANYGVK